MPDFDYIARELSGKQVNGTIAAASEKEALGNLQGQNLFPVKIALSAATQKHNDVGPARHKLSHPEQYWF